tara:strand:- start:894 stop:1070 length:177 start_codon:yes stop_codon:yes gene_type:complete
MPTKKDIEKYPESLIQEYISTLSPLETQVMEIAKQDLEKSFDIRKSIGFISWLKKKEI